MTGFGVHCPLCGSQDSAITVELNDLGTIRCDCCDETFTPADAVARVREQLAAWERVAAWLRAAK